MLKNWLECKAPEIYDFVEDAQKNKNGRDYGKIENPYERFLIYKYTDRNKPNWSMIEKRNGIFEDIDGYVTQDPDSSSYLLQAIYKQLWQDLVEQDFMKGTKKKWIYSDTMTSAMFRFQDALMNMETKFEEAEKAFERIQLIRGGCRKQYWWSKNRCILVAADLNRDFYKIVDEQYPKMKEFLKSSHTIGNYCPVPRGFNGARAGGGAYDCWDLTLMKIREWYKADKEDTVQRDIILKELLHYNKNIECIENCKKWLEWFEKHGKNDGWHNFVDILYMNSYVEGEDYEVIPYWTGHGWEKDKTLKFPENRREINNALEKIANRIKARSKKMVAACKTI